MNTHDALKALHGWKFWQWRRAGMSLFQELTQTKECLERAQFDLAQAKVKVMSIEEAHEKLKTKHKNAVNGNRAALGFIWAKHLAPKARALVGLLLLAAWSCVAAPPFPPPILHNVLTTNDVATTGQNITILNAVGKAHFVVTGTLTNNTTGNAATADFVNGNLTNNVAHANSAEVATNAYGLSGSINGYLGLMMDPYGTNVVLDPSTHISGNGLGLNTLNASALASGTVPIAVLSGPLQLLSTNNGSGLTNLNASQLTTGTVPVGVLPGVAILTNNQTFTGINTFSNTVNIDDTHALQFASNSTVGFKYLANNQVISLGSVVVKAGQTLNADNISGTTGSGTPIILNASGGSAGGNYFRIQAHGVEQANFATNGVFVSGTLTATNGVFGAYGCLTMSTGIVSVATSTSTNLFTDWAYKKSFGGIGIETNANFVCTNAGDYRISFGCSMLGGNGDAVKTLVFTNDTVCPIIMFEKTMQSPAVAETGFKEFVVSLPALCRVSCRIADLSATATSIQNICFNIKGAN